VSARPPSTQYLYSVYGLTVASEIELPELAPGVGAPALRIVLPAGDGAASEPVGPSGASVDGGVMRLAYNGVVSLAIRAGSEIAVRPAPGADPLGIRALVLGPALAVALHQRGVLALHASSVLLPAGVVGFLGGSGWGKSTLAASLQRRGHQLVADDVTAVHAAADEITVMPAFPQLKLWPEAAAALGLDPAALPRVSAAEEKRARAVPTRLPAGRLQLAALYVLLEDETLRVERLSARDALLELVRHSFCAPRLVELGAGDHFLQCAAVARRVPVRRLRRPRVLARLDDVAALVEEDASRAS
jgi:hypothetical protein